MGKKKKNYVNVTRFAKDNSYYVFMLNVLIKQTYTSYVNCFANKKYNLCFI